MTSRAAVRIVCLDPAGRVLMLHWRDPASGGDVWEPPGGGIEAGESPLEAARRELFEETGLDGAAVTPHEVEVARDFRWAGVHFVGTETFFLARFADARVPGAAALTEEEAGALVEHRWCATAELATLGEALQPPELAAVVAALTAATTGGAAAAGPRPARG